MRRGEVWLAQLEPRFGAEPGKLRPVAIVQSQMLIDSGYKTTLIVPLTTQLIAGTEPLRVRIKPEAKLKKESDALVGQLRAIDNRRLVRGPLAKLEASTVRRLDDAIRQVLELDE